jgi:cellulose synthase operon protein B
MKQLFLLSQISKKAIVVTFCFLLFPNSQLSARAIGNNDLQEAKPNQSNSSVASVLGTQTLLAQAATPTAQTSKKPEAGATTTEPVDAKGLVTHNLEFNLKVVLALHVPVVGNSTKVLSKH